MSWERSSNYRAGVSKTRGCGRESHRSHHFSRIAAISERKFIKGSKWKITKPLTAQGIIIPAGTVLEVMYPPHRDDGSLAVSTSDWKLNNELRSKTWIGNKYAKAFTKIFQHNITDAEEMHIPDTWQYFIRLKGTEKLWGGGSYSPVSFQPRRFSDSEATCYVNKINALRGIVYIVKNRYLREQYTPKSFEIVGRRSKTEETIVFEAPVTNIENIYRIMENFRDIKSKFGKEIERICFRLICAEGEQIKWNCVGLYRDSVIRRGMFNSNFDRAIREIGITQYQPVIDPSAVFLSEADAMLLKIKLAASFDYAVF